MKRFYWLLPALLTAGISTQAQDKKSDKKWDVNAPEGPYKLVQFTTSEGTWMNLDL